VESKYSADSVDASLAALLRMRADRQPDRHAYTFLLDGVRDEASLTYAELDRRASAVAAELGALSSPGDRALLLYPPGLDYLVGLFGCLYGAVVAVPAYPPQPSVDRTFSRLAAIVRDARPTVVLTTTAISSAAAGLADLMPEFRSVRWLATDRLDPLHERPDSRPVTRETVALLQYTSGSTAAPKGVVLSHGNLLDNSALIYDLFGHSADSHGMVWLPPYHDMGLIGGILQPLYSGFPVTLMSPLDFLHDPIRWLQAMSRLHATTSGGPNFAYDLCVRKTTPDERAGLDLSGWRVAFNGAEPIRPHTMDAFADAFADVGFRREAFQPCYGLAEATLIVSGGRSFSASSTRAVDSAALERHEATPHSADSTARHLVGCGGVEHGEHRVEIVDPATRRVCPPRRVGEIWFRGPSVAQGYWGKETESERTFRAFVADTGEGPFLRTGDLGFVDDGQLIVTGRIKDLVIIRGRNYYPQDIELAAERSHPAIRRGCSAAFTVDDDVQRLVIACELAAYDDGVDTDAIINDVVAAVSDELGVQPQVVVLLDRGSIPKTSSGKVQRRLCATLFVAGELAERGRRVVGQRSMVEPRPVDRADLLSAPPERRRALLEDYLRARIAATGGVAGDSTSLDRPLLAQGLDSLGLLELAHAMEDDLGARVTLTALLDASRAGDVVTLLDEQLARAVDSGPAPSTEEASSTDGEMPLSHGQRALWFLTELAPDRGAHNIAVTALLRGELDADALRRSFDQLVRRHAQLRTTFTARDGVPMQRVAAAGVVRLRENDVRGVPEERFRNQLATAARQPFDLSTGPLLRVELYRRTPREAVLLLVVHHIVTDFWSMSLLVHELEALYREHSGGRPALLRDPRGSYADFVGRDERLVRGEEGERLRRYWTSQLDGSTAAVRWPRRPDYGTLADQGMSRSLRVSAELTEGLRHVALANGTTLYMVLLGAFQMLLHTYTEETDFVVGTPMAARGAAHRETFGLIMNPVMIRCQVTGATTLREVLADTRRRVAGALDHQGYPAHRLTLDRDAGPLCSVMFTFNRPPMPDQENLALLAMGVPGPAIRFGPLEIEPVPLPPSTASLDLHLTMAEIEGELYASFSGRAEVFDEIAADRLVRLFHRQLERIVDDIDIPVSHLRDDAYRAHVAPRTAIEERLAEIWRRLLRTEPIGVDDDFYMLGGDSRLTVQLLASMELEFDVELTLRDVAPATTVAELATAVVEARVR